MAEPSNPTHSDLLTRYATIFSVVTIGVLLAVRLVYRPLRLEDSPLSNPAIEMELRRWLQTPSRRSQLESSTTSVASAEPSSDLSKMPLPLRRYLPAANQWVVRPSDRLHQLGVRRMVFLRFDPKALWMVTAGEDGAPGHVNVDDGFNGQVDDASEFGATGSDDVFVVVPPEVVEDGSLAAVPHVVLSRGGHVVCPPNEPGIDRVHLLGEHSERMIDGVGRWNASNDR